jgi:hypothetical protein
LCRGDGIGIPTQKKYNRNTTAKTPRSAKKIERERVRVREITAA